MAISAWTMVACAAGILASRRYGTQARLQRGGDALCLRCWSVLAFAAWMLSAYIAIRSFGLSVGIAYWLATLSLCGAVVVAGVAARPALAVPAVWVSTLVGAISSGALAWTN